MGAFRPNRKSKVKVTNYVWSWQLVKRLRASGNEQQWLTGAPPPPLHTHCWAPGSSEVQSFPI